MLPYKWITLHQDKTWIINTDTAWKVSQCEVISGPYFPVFSPNTGICRPEITPYLDNFHGVQISLLTSIKKPPNYFAEHCNKDCDKDCDKNVDLKCFNPDYSLKFRRLFIMYNVIIWKDHKLIQMYGVHLVSKCLL